jgi:(5-formylfuran-3-yl)methyl phosphate synthase
MAKLMISVRSAEEAKIAIQAGADFIDVKEPKNGALGAASSKVWRDVAKAIDQTERRKDQNAIVSSLALGELLDLPTKLAEASMTGYKYAKIGLATCSSFPDWKEWLKIAFSMFPKKTAKVAVAYADYAHALSPTPSEILKAGKQLRCKAFLIDTYDKSKGDVFEVMPISTLRKLFAEAHEYGMLTVLGGSLKIGRMTEILEVNPDIVALRRGVCQGDRLGDIIPEMVSLWKNRLSKPQRGPRPHIHFGT